MQYQDFLASVFKQNMKLEISYTAEKQVDTQALLKHTMILTFILFLLFQGSTRVHSKVERISNTSLKNTPNS